jgi:Domain of unknown function (DUF4440)
METRSTLEPVSPENLSPEQKELYDALTGPLNLVRREWKVQPATRGYWEERYAEDAISLSCGGPLLSGRDAVVDELAAKYVGSEIGILTDIVRLDVVGEIGIVWGRFRFGRVPTAEIPALERRGYWIAIFKKEGGRWLLWQEMDSHSPDGNIYYDHIPPGPSPFGT